MTNPYFQRQSIGTSSDWTYQSTSSTPLTSTSFPLTPVSAAGDPFCTDIFCQDNENTDNDADFYTSRYRYVRYQAVWSINQLGTIQTWPARSNPGQTVYTSGWFNTEGTRPILALGVGTFGVYNSVSPAKPQSEGNPYWLINLTMVGASNAEPWSQNSQGSFDMLYANPNGTFTPAGGGTASYILPIIMPGDFVIGVAGKFQFTNGPLLGFPPYGSASAIVDWSGLPVPSTWIYS